MSQIAIEFNGVWKRFKKGEIYNSLRDLIPAITKNFFSKNDRGDLQAKEFWVLKDVSFQVKKGEAVGIIGHNGAGKSTTLKLLSNILKPNKGEIRCYGKLSVLIEVSAGFHPDLTGRENVYLNGAILGMKKKEIDLKFDEIVDFSGLEEFIDTPVKRYSTGMYARLGFSVAAHMDPEILLVDEVLSVGDWAFQRKCMERMTSLFESGCTIIFVSHNLRSIASLCQKCILLDHGEVLQSGPSEKVIKKYLSMASTHDNTHVGKEVFISKAVIRDNWGERSRFDSGQKAFVEIDITANIDCSNLAIGIYLKDENYYQVFNTSTERLGFDPFSMKAGETKNLLFELSLHLARGTFYWGVFVKRYDIEKTYDDLFPAITLFITSQKDVRGVVNLDPQIPLLQTTYSNTTYSHV